MLKASIESYLLLFETFGLNLDDGNLVFFGSRREDGGLYEEPVARLHLGSLLPLLLVLLLGLEGGGLPDVLLVAPGQGAGPELFLNVTSREISGSGHGYDEVEGIVTLE